MPYADGLGRVFNVIPAASGVHIPLTNAQAVSFVLYAAAGDQTVTLKESVDGNSEANLAVIDHLYKAPGIGGTWAAVAQAAAATYTHADATNDAIVFTVGAEKLSDGFNCVEVTAGGTTPICIAIVHDIKVQRAPELLATNVDV